ncbi:hypothetical protein VNO77_39415 [Canavalia gladiata]|uniref:Uncharacterized protein n=1 Tax=Canavalia gladiata TaxID=3824 RepID=A0AAN9KB24_CANGL
MDRWRLVLRKAALWPTSGLVAAGVQRDKAERRALTIKLCDVGKGQMLELVDIKLHYSQSWIGAAERRWRVLFLLGALLLKSEGTGNHIREDQEKERVRIKAKSRTKRKKLEIQDPRFLVIIRSNSPNKLVFILSILIRSRSSLEVIHFTRMKGKTLFLHKGD